MEQQESEGSSSSRGLSGVDKYELDWRNILTIANDATLYDLRHMAVRGDLRASPFRSVCWAVFLGSLKPPSSEWVTQREAHREDYFQLKDRYMLNPHLNTDGSDDPLSQSSESLWNQHFCDQELCAVIKQDVVRTFPGVDFFRKAPIQDMMTNILFCYARRYPAMCYRQGMHEILAPLLFVIHSDQQAMAHIQELDPSVDHNLVSILNPAHLEEDSFSIFSKIMDRIASFYRITDLVPTATGYFPAVAATPAASPPPTDLTATTVIPTKRKPEIEVVEQLNYIKDRILIKEDLHLHNHLLKLDIPLAIFGIRWLRLLFGREFALQDLLLLWDAIFGEGEQLSLVNYIVVAMLIRIRDKLIYSDYTTCLTYLMRYPTNVDISLIIKHALHMKSPKIYERPAGAMIYVSSPSTKRPLPQPVMRSKNIEMDYLKYSTLPTVHQKRQQVQEHPLQVRPVIDERHRTSSLPRNVGGGSVRKASAYELRQKAAIAAKKAAAASNVHGETMRDSSISDGYLEDDPELLKIELQDAYNIMSVSRAKLLQYLAVVRRHVRPGNPTGELQQSLEGIEEICSLLKPRYDTVFRTPVPIDAATEANEIPSNRPLTAAASSQVIPAPQRTQTPPTSLNLQRSYNYDLDCRRNSAASISQYEIPEDLYSGIATKKLANRKEVEMHVFQADFNDRQRRVDDKEMPSVNPLRAGGAGRRNSE